MNSELMLYGAATIAAIYFLFKLKTRLELSKGQTSFVNGACQNVPAGRQAYTLLRV